MSDIVYDIPSASQAVASHTLAIIVDNEFGVLARVIGLFSGRGYNIESLTVAEVQHDKKLSRITIVTSGSDSVIQQIRRQLERMVPVHKVRDLTEEGIHLERELLLVRVKVAPEHRDEIQHLAKTFHARLLDESQEGCIYEVTDRSDKLDAFLDLLRPLGLAETARSGVVAIARGKKRTA